MNGKIEYLHMCAYKQEKASTYTYIGGRGEQ